MTVLTRALGVSLLALALAAGASAASARTADAKRPLGPQARLAEARVVLPTNVAPKSYDVLVTPDMAAKTFTGHVDIALDVKAPTRTIKLNAAELTFSRVSLTGASGAPLVSFDPEEQTATLTFKAPVAAGAHTLSIDYAGKINEHAAGLFSLAYDAPGAAGGGRKQALFTQFENSDARRFVPSWDEPNRKATFTLSAIVPADLMAVSNMPQASSQDAGRGLKKVTFATTPKMSSYLLFFGLGDFERIHKNVNGVDVGVVFKRGDAAQAEYALDAAAHILPYYNNYFGVNYPLPKLDMIAGPGQSQFFGAMENWGAIFYFERDLLIDPKISTDRDRQNVYIVVAHEMAHQWFGDLVTMDWWDDLWLNEGFASWMEDKATNQFHPEWNLPLQALGSKEGAMRLDAREGTHPVIGHIRDVLQAQQAFDAITYQKGEAVISMLEAYVGEDAWRAGVRNYMKRHAYGNTTTDDLWREIDAVSPAKLTDIAHDFTLQPGVPLVQARETCSGGVTSTALTQSRFGVDAASRVPQSWRVPVSVRYAGSADVQRGVVSREAPKTFRIDGCGAVVVNAGQKGYFRTAYPPEAFGRILQGYGALPAVDQLGLANDSAALGEAGNVPMSEFLDLTTKLPADADPVVISGVVGRLSGLDDLLDGLPSQPAFRAYARGVIAPVLARVGWEARPGEGDNVGLLRDTLIGALSEFDDPAVVAEARRRFTAYVKDPASLSPAARHTVLRVAALHADAATWDALHRLAKAAPTALTKDEYYSLLGLAKDPALARRALDLAISGEPEATEGPTMIRMVSYQHPDMAFDFYAARLDKVNAVLEPDSRNQFAPDLLAGAHDAALAAKLEAYAQAHIPATARGQVVKSLSAIRYRAEVRRLRTPEIAAWLQRHG